MLLHFNHFSRIQILLATFHRTANELNFGSIILPHIFQFFSVNQISIAFTSCLFDLFIVVYLLQLPLFDNIFLHISLELIHPLLDLYEEGPLALRHFVRALVHRQQEIYRQEALFVAL